MNTTTTTGADNMSTTWLAERMTNPKHWEHINLVRHYVSKRLAYRKNDGGYDVLMDGELFGTVQKDEDPAPRYVAGQCYTYGYSKATSWFPNLSLEQKEKVLAHSGNRIRLSPMKNRKDAAASMVAWALIRSGRSVAFLADARHEP
jgi:hypothetical protein